MNLTVNLVSLVLASTTGWVLLVFGALPVSVLRTHPREPLLAAAAWAVVAATAPPQVFHWYLIFAVFSLVAFTKLHRPAGKMWLAIAAALGLGLGIIFPLKATPSLFQHENPFMLALLHAGGAVTALAYAIGVTGSRDLTKGWQPLGLARGLLIASAGWLALLVARYFLAPSATVRQPVGMPLSAQMFSALNGALFGSAMVEMLLAALIVRGVSRSTHPVLALPACGLALAQSFVAQFIYA